MKPQQTATADSLQIVAESRRRARPPNLWAESVHENTAASHQGACKYQRKYKRRGGCGKVG
jgi:hypothetical protein